jgi:hypothetical protein
MPRAEQFHGEAIIIGPHGNGPTFSSQQKQQPMCHEGERTLSRPTVREAVCEEFANGVIPTLSVLRPVGSIVDHATSTSIRANWRAACDAKPMVRTICFLDQCNGR